MKTILIRCLVAGVVVCGLIPVSMPAAPYGVAEIVVKRAANFGSNLDLSVYIDGQHVARVQWGTRYEAAIPAGSHQVTVAVANRLKTSGSTGTSVVLVPGQTRELTAGFSGRELVLASK